MVDNFHVLDHPAHLITDLYMEGRFLQSKACPLSANERFFSTCHNLITLMKLNISEGEGVSPLEIEDLEYVPNLLDVMQQALRQVTSMIGKKSKKTSLDNDLEKTFNSLVLIYPAIKNILDHPKKNETSLNMKNGPMIQKRNRDAECYVIGNKVYSIVKTKRLKEIRNGIHIIESVIDPVLLRAFGEIDYSRLSEILPLICDHLLRESSFIIEKSLQFPLDQTVEAFGKQFDEQLIHPLSQDRASKQNDFEKSIDKLNFALSDLLSAQFDGHLDIYGSCLSGLALGNSSDVDISLHDHFFAKKHKDYEEGKISEDQFKRIKKGIAFRLCHLLQSQGRGAFSNIEAIVHARVPVIKGIFLHANNPFSCDGSLEFDICFLNRIAVVNSNLIKEYSKIDPRIRSLMLAVKAWVKTNNIGSAADGFPSSYTWMIMVIFYLQVLGVVPNLQSSELIEKCKSTFNPRNSVHVVNGLRTHHVTYDMVRNSKAWFMPEKFQTTPTCCLLSGFFTFYAKIFPWETTAVSIRLGNMTLKKTVFRSARLWRMAIEDPFETHSSHMPHDLGRPVTMTTQPKIYAELLKIANSMERQLSTRDKIEDCIGSMNYIQDRPVDAPNTSDIPLDSTGDSRTRKKHKKKSKQKQTQFVATVDESQKSIDADIVQKTEQQLNIRDETEHSIGSMNYIQDRPVDASNARGIPLDSTSDSRTRKKHKKKSKQIQKQTQVVETIG